MSALSTRATDEGEYNRTVTKCWSLCYPAEANATRLSRQRPRRSSPLSSAPGPDAAASADESDGMEDEDVGEPLDYYIGNLDG